MNYPVSITKEELSDLPLCGFEGRLKVVNNQKDLKKAIDYLSGFRYLGFDSETKPAFKKGVLNDVSLIQISTEDICFLFRVNYTGITEELKSLFENKNVIKIGLSLRDDMRGMRRLAEFAPQGFIDLQEMVADFGIDDRSLKKIAGIVLNKRISKKQRLTNWESGELTEAQQRYAATDAWICLEIYKQLVS